MTASNRHISNLLEMMRKFNELDSYQFNKKITSENLKKFLANPDLGRIWLIEKEKTIIGYLILTFCFSFEYKGTYAYIDEIYLEKEFQNQGIGTQAMKFAMREAKKLNIKMLYLEVEPHNKPAKSLYKKLGFRENKRSLMMRKP